MRSCFLRKWNRGVSGRCDLRIDCCRPFSRRTDLQNGAYRTQQPGSGDASPLCRLISLPVIAKSRPFLARRHHAERPTGCRTPSGVSAAARSIDRISPQGRHAPPVRAKRTNTSVSKRNATFVRVVWHAVAKSVRKTACSFFDRLRIVTYIRLCPEYSPVGAPAPARLGCELLWQLV